MDGSSLTVLSLYPPNLPPTHPTYLAVVGGEAGLELIPILGLLLVPQETESGVELHDPIEIHFELGEGNEGAIWMIFVERHFFPIHVSRAALAPIIHLLVCHGKHRPSVGGWVGN